MIELLVLMAVAYAGARGVEAIFTPSNSDYDTPEARKTVGKIAASKPTGSKAKKEPPGPTDPGGTFRAAAPRSAKVGEKVAVPVAVIAETGATMWKATLEGYRERWPEIRAEHREKMAERAAKRKADKKAAAAVKTAGPPPVFPPLPSEPPKVSLEKDPKPPKVSLEKAPKVSLEKAPKPPSGPAESVDPDGSAAEAEEAADAGREDDTGRVDPVTPDTRSADIRVETAEIRVERARKEAQQAREEAARAHEEAARAREEAAAAKAAAAEKAEREAKERADAAEARANDATSPDTTDPAKPSPDQPTTARHLVAVPSPAPNGDMMTSPETIIPEIRTLTGFMNALMLIKAMCGMRAEEAAAIAGDDLALSNKLDEIEASLGEMEVDDGTRGEIDALRESIHSQSQAAAAYGGAAQDTGDFAVATAGAAYKSHGGIAEAVQSSPIDRAAQGGYYDR